MSSVVALLTDFGCKDHYVASMKGVLLAKNPKISIVDITHEVAPQNISQAAYYLKASIDFFPDRTIFLVVVDPGVGSDRDILVASISDKYIVVPDNGILSALVDGGESIDVRTLNYKNSDTSSTFHGRDVMSPFVAELSLNNEVYNSLETKKEIVKIRFEKPLFNEGCIEGSVLLIDTYGNVITNISSNDLKKHNVIPKEVVVADLVINSFVKCYSDNEPSSNIALINSSNYLECASVNGSLASNHKILVGDRVRVFL